MAKKKDPQEGAKKVNNPNVMGLRPEVLEQPITETRSEEHTSEPSHRSQSRMPSSA